MYLNYRELDADIIIIGGGITGLCAAYHLLEKDPHLDFLILDVTDEKPDLSSENAMTSLRNAKRSNPSNKNEKKTWFSDENLESSLENRLYCSPKQTSLMQLLRKLNVGVVENVGNVGKVLVDHDENYEVQNRNEMFDFLPLPERVAFNICCSKINALSKMVSMRKTTSNSVIAEFDIISMETLLEKLTDKKKIRDIISQTFLVNCGLEAKDVSASFFLYYTKSTFGIENQFHRNINGFYECYIDGGANNLKTKIIEIIDEDSIEKTSEISEISWDDYSIGIKSSNQYFFANRIIYTLCEGETKRIKFTPSLSDAKQAVSNNFVQGNLKKFLVIYEEPFWLNKNLSGDVYVMNTSNRNGPVKICLNTSDAKSNKYALTGLVDNDTPKDVTLKQLASYFGEEALTPSYYEENRSSLLDFRFPHGCISMAYFGNIRGDSERIIWASPETATCWYGTAAGSLEAGFEGAIRLLHDAKPNMLSISDLDILSPMEVIIPPRRLGVFGFKWHLIVPVTLLTLFVVMKLKKYIAKKLVS